MQDRAKIFMNGRSQAVRLPARYRFDCEEVFIKEDPETGDIILSKRPDNWDGFFEMAEHIEVPDDFLSEREDNNPPQERED